MRLLLAYILIALLASPAIAQSADLTGAVAPVIGAVGTLADVEPICYCYCDIDFLFDGLDGKNLWSNPKCTDIIFKDPAITNKKDCLALIGEGCKGWARFKEDPTCRPEAAPPINALYDGTFVFCKYASIPILNP